MKSLKPPPPSAQRSKKLLPKQPAASGMMRERDPRRIYLIGNGTSLYSSMAASYTARSLAAGDDPLVLAWPAGDFRYFTPQLNRAGHHRRRLGFRGVPRRAGRLRSGRERVPCVGITHIPDSSITRLAHETLLSGGGPSSVPVMTKTYASTLTAAHLLLMEFFGAGRSVYDQLRSVPRSLCARAR